MVSKNDEAPTAVTVRASNLSVTTKELTMNSLATQVTTINVPFHGDNLYLVSFNGEPYVPMKPVVEGMGLTWQPQHEKLKTRFNKGIT
ncbi:phage antirepressor N-terminal domain-containing protein, partial [Escherichia coli]